MCNTNDFNDSLLGSTFKLAYPFFFVIDRYACKNESNYLSLRNKTLNIR